MGGLRNTHPCKWQKHVAIHTHTSLDEYGDKNLDWSLLCIHQTVIILSDETMQYRHLNDV